MKLESAHSQLGVLNGITGVQQLTIGGQPQTPGQIGLEAFEFGPVPSHAVDNPKVGGPFCRSEQYHWGARFKFGFRVADAAGRRAYPNSVELEHQAAGICRSAAIKLMSTDPRRSTEENKRSGSEELGLGSVTVSPILLEIRLEAKARVEF
jgi:hypothetical protein